MAMLRSIFASAAALSLLGCASAPAPPDAAGAIARLSPEELARLMPKPNPRLTLADLVRMSKEGAAAADLVAKIKETGSRYELSASQMIALHAQGVSAEVLDYIQSAREQDVRDRMTEEINQRERRHADELQREQAWRAETFYCDRWWPGYPGYGWNYPYPLRPFGGFYWGR